MQNVSDPSDLSGSEASAQEIQDLLSRFEDGFRKLIESPAISEQQRELLRAELARASMGSLAELKPVPVGERNIKD